MKKLFLSLIILISTINLIFAQKSTDYEQLCREVSELLVANNKTDFVKRFCPTKEDLFELSYGSKANKVKKKERVGFYETIGPTLGMLEENISSSFDFVYGKMGKNKILKIDNVDIQKSTKTKIEELEVQNFFFVVSDGQNQFNLELLGVFRSSRDWVILTDIAPWNF